MHGAAGRSTDRSRTERGPDRRTDPGLACGGVARPSPSAPRRRRRATRLDRRRSRHRGSRATRQGQGGERTEPDDDGPELHRRDEPVDERDRRDVRPVGREHGSQDGHPEHAAELADRVVRARRLALLLRPDGRQDDVGDRGEEQAHAGAGHDERRHERQVLDGRGDERPTATPSATAWRAMPRTSSGRVPVRVERSPAIGATMTGMNVHGRVRRPASSGL